ncbi:AraC family transcriptional regulator [Pseudomonas sp. NPDC088368]|uniref:AraC family transcriptional regulator n=1 Tax=Pseudomonas sp. NPDC088368 TaxID=3364453 RepID=UPI0038151B3D
MNLPKIEANPMRENDLNAVTLAPNAGSIDSPKKTDVLSQVLALVRLKGETVFTGTLSDDALAVNEGVSRFYFVETGRMWLSVADDQEDPLEVEEGDLVLLPHGNLHSLAKALAAKNSKEVRTVRSPAQTAIKVYPDTHYIGGLFRFDGGKLPPILASLPSIIHVPAGPSGTPAWLQAISHFLLHEANQIQPGAELMVSRLIDLLVIRALRTWSTSAPGRLGFIAGLGDDRIAQALAALHAAPYKAWTVPELASVASMSRSSFADHFSATVGEAPLRYLTRWRLHLASEMLSGGSMRVSEVAERVGYASDAAFSRAYKACFGYSPSESVPKSSA